MNSVDQSGGFKGAIDLEGEGNDEEDLEIRVVDGVDCGAGYLSEASPGGRRDRNEKNN